MACVAVRTSCGRAQEREGMRYFVSKPCEERYLLQSEVGFRLKGWDTESRQGSVRFHIKVVGTPSYLA
eukprot:scaffold23050_cov129-Skeletonema_marinoi.AAC.4